jgi:hypothetical protein
MPFCSDQALDIWELNPVSFVWESNTPNHPRHTPTAMVHILLLFSVCGGFCRCLETLSINIVVNVFSFFLRLVCQNSLSFTDLRVGCYLTISGVLLTPAVADVANLKRCQNVYIFFK